MSQYDSSALCKFSISLNEPYIIQCNCNSSYASNTIAPGYIGVLYTHGNHGLLIVDNNRLERCDKSFTFIEQDIFDVLN